MCLPSCAFRASLKRARCVQHALDVVAKACAISPPYPRFIRPSAHPETYRILLHMLPPVSSFAVTIQTSKPVVVLRAGDYAGPGDCTRWHHIRPALHPKVADEPRHLPRHSGPHAPGPAHVQHRRPRLCLRLPRRRCCGRHLERLGASYRFDMPKGLLQSLSQQVWRAPTYIVNTAL